jgi:hypothetical protein
MGRKGTGYERSEAVGSDGIANAGGAPLHEVQFKPNKPITVPKDKGARTKMVNGMAANIEETFNATSRHDKHEGAMFYPHAHNDARALASGGNPRPYGPAAKAPVYTPPVPGQKRLHEVTPEETRQAAGVIARLSPSSPSGMTWEHNVGAAHQIMHMSDDEVKNVVGMSTRSVKNQGSLAHAGTQAIVGANEIAKGRQTTDQNIQTGDKRVKIGSFANNIADPQGSTNVTVDARSHDIATGKRRGWEDVNPNTGAKVNSRGLSSKKRYDLIEEAHNQAAVSINKREGTSYSGKDVQAATWLGDDRAAHEEGTRTGGRGAQGGAGARNKVPVPLGQSAKRVYPK